MAGAVINRSLSGKELEILTTINALHYNKFPWISTRISDALIKNQPTIEAQQCTIDKQQLEKVYEKNDAYLQIINEYLDPTEQLTTRSTLSDELIPEKSPEQLNRIHEEELISVHLIGNTLLEALTQKPQRKLSNNTVDAIIELSQSGSVSKSTEVELLKLAQENRPQGKQLRKILERAKKQLSNS